MRLPSINQYYRSSHLDGLAWDWVNEKLYWTDECNNHIKAYDPRTGNVTLLLETGATTNPRSIVVDPATR